MPDDDQPVGSPRQFRIAGVTFTPHYPHNLLALQDYLVEKAKGPPNLELEASRDPDNPHDENAISLHLSGLGMLGHVPRELAAVLAPRLDKGELWRFVLIRILISGEDATRPGALVYYYRPDGTEIDPLDSRLSSESAKKIWATMTQGEKGEG